MKVVAISNWEYGGFYPESHKLPFYESPKKSGVQVKTISGMAEIKELLACSSLLMGFLRQAHAGLATGFCTIRVKLVFVVFSAQWRGRSK